MPLFSSVAYTGPRTTQADIERSVANMRANSWVPFNAVYAGGINTEHVLSRVIPGLWNNLFATEFGLTISTACQQTPGNVVLPAPRFSVPQTYCPLELATFQVSDASYLGNLYDYQWEVTGTNYRRTGTGETFSVRHNVPGIYTVRVTRRYRTGNGASVATSKTMTILPSSNAKCNNSPDPDPRTYTTKEKLVTTDTMVAPSQPVKLWPNPAHGQLHIAYQMSRAGKVSITLMSAIGTQQSESILTTSDRPEGSYEEIYRTDHLADGLYIVTVRTDHEILQNKVIIE